jgi:hypothetical protein
MIVTDKPAESWTDKDVTRFEVKLADLARRFRNLEALQKEVAARGHGFDALRLTVTESDGHEAHQLIWAEPQHQERVNNLLAKALPQLENLDPQSRNALLIYIVKHLLSSDEPNTHTQDPKRSSQSSKTIEV